ncbi:MAG: hypothetical protein MK180_00385 [Rhodobacteraceae bacterium]|nr:hypothetical protein [Paracoccaceae bacterium]
MQSDTPGGTGTPPKHDQAPSDPRGKAIVDRVLEEVGETVADRDFVAFAAYLGLPYAVSTSERREVIEDLAGLEKMYRRSIEYLNHDGVSEMCRRTVSATFVDVATIWALVETRLVHFGSQIRREPYFVHCELYRRADKWLFTSRHYAISDDPLHMAALVPGP